MTEYIEKKKAIQEIIDVYEHEFPTASGEFDRFVSVIVPQILKNMPASDVEPVRHGRWLLEAHEERVNCRWSVTAECSECCDEKKEIWAGFFPGVPSWLARDTALLYAAEVKPINYCHNCGAKMDKEEEQLEWERNTSSEKEVPSDGR